MWIIINVLISYLIIFGITLILGNLCLNQQLVWSYYSQLEILSLMKVKLTGLEFLISIILLYLSTSVAISLVQVTLSLIVKPIYAYFIIIIFLILSIFSDYFIMFGQHSLILRHTMFDSIHNLTLTNSLVYNFIVSISSIIIGLVWVKRKDII